MSRHYWWLNGRQASRTSQFLTAHLPITSDNHETPNWSWQDGTCLKSSSRTSWVVASYLAVGKDVGDLEFIQVILVKFKSGIIQSLLLLPHVKWNLRGAIIESIFAVLQLGIIPSYMYHIGPKLVVCNPSHIFQDEDSSIFLKFLIFWVVLSCFAKHPSHLKFGLKNTTKLLMHSAPNIHHLL